MIVISSQTEFLFNQETVKVKGSQKKLCEVLKKPITCVNHCKEERK